MDVVTGYIDGSTCESRAQQVHSRILNYIIEQKNEAEGRRDYYLELDAAAQNNPECQCVGEGTPPPGEADQAQEEPDEGPPSS